MTVAANYRDDYLGTGATADYDFTFEITAKAELSVRQRDIATGIETTLVLDSDFTIPDADVNNADGGTITLAAGVLAAGQRLSLRRALPITQETDLRNQGAYQAEDVEDAFDRGVKIAQQHQDEIDRSLKLPESELPAATVVIPAKETRSSKYLAFDAQGDPMAADGTAGVPASGFGATLIDDADAATARATLGFSPFGGTLGAIADAAAARTTLGGAVPSVATLTALRALAGTDLTGHVLVAGYGAAGDGGGGLFTWSAADSTADNASTVIAPNAGGVGRWNRIGGYTTFLDIREFGAKGDGVTDDTTALTRARDFVAAASPVPTLVFQPGTYLYTASPNWAIAGLRIIGNGATLKCTGGGRAFNMDGGGSAVYGICVNDLNIVGNAATTVIFYQSGIAHSRFRNIRAREADSAAGIAFHIKWAVCNVYEHLVCSTNEQAMVAIPHYGVVLDATSGLYATCNTFIQTIMEGVAIGLRLLAADQNLFIGGTFEACTVYGVLGTAGSFNTLDSIAMESNTTADVLNSTTMLRLRNCYSKSLITGNGCRQMVIEGGAYQQITLDSGCSQCRVTDCQVSFFTAGGGITDASDRAYIRNVYDTNLAVVRPLKDFVSRVVDVSPFTFTNDTNFSIQAIVRGGTVSDIQWLRNGTSTTIAGSLGLDAEGSFVLAPGDALVITYAVLPELITGEV